LGKIKVIKVGTKTKFEPLTTVFFSTVMFAFVLLKFNFEVFLGIVTKVGKTRTGITIFLPTFIISLRPLPSFLPPLFQFEENDKKGEDSQGKGKEREGQREEIPWVLFVCSRGVCQRGKLDLLREREREREVKGKWTGRGRSIVASEIVWNSDNLLCTRI
jgi:hypothetical protein